MADAQTLRVNFSSLEAPDGPSIRAAIPEPGWVDWIKAADQASPDLLPAGGQTETFGSALGMGNTVDVTLLPDLDANHQAGAFPQFRNNSSVTTEPGLSIGPNMLGSRLGVSNLPNNQARVPLSITNLVNGSYDLTIYHHENNMNSGAGTWDEISVNGVVATNVLTSVGNGANPIGQSFFQFNVTTNVANILFTKTDLGADADFGEANVNGFILALTMGGDIQNEMASHNASAFTRTTFQVADPVAVDSLDLQLDYDDGYAVYLNGTEVARRNAPAGSLAFDAQATQSAGGNSGGVWDLADDWTTDPTGNSESSTWSYRWEPAGDPTSRDGDYNLLSQGSYLDTLWDTGDPAFLPPDFWVAAANDGPLAWKNESASALGSSILFTAPAGTVVTHTDTSEMAVHSWLSPIDGTVQVRMQATNLENSGGTRYFIEKNDSSNTLLDIVLGIGVGTSTGVQTVEDVQVSVGDRINLVVDPVVQAGRDSQATEFTITRLDAIGHETLDLTSHLGQLVAGTIPGQPASTIVQFYVEGQDTLGAVSTFPAAGQDSRALYKVQDGQGTSNPIDTVRIVMTAAEATDLFAPTEVMSNANRGATVIHNNSEVFYDVGVRLKGSLFGRRGHDGVNPGSYRIQFHPDHKFRGVHESLSLDGSGRSSFLFGDGQDEILITHLMNHAGGISSLYHDLGYMIAPNTSHTRPVIMMMARYTDVFLEESFGNDSDGTLYEFEIIQYMNQTTDGNPASLKTSGSGQTWLGTDFGNMGDVKEDYRWNYLIKNQRARDNYDNIITTAKAFDLTGTALDQALEPVIDVDQWMRMYAMHSLAGQLDVYGIDAAPHNIWLYDHPGTGKIMVLPWDMDFAFTRPINAPLHNNANHPEWNIRNIVNRPQNLRLFYGHLQDMIQTTFNGTYAGNWFTRFGTLVDQNYLPHVTYIQSRADFVSSQLNTLAPQVPFAITTNNPLDVGAATTATLEGTGWIDAHEIRLVGENQPLDLTWTVGSGASYAQTWQTTVSLQFGSNNYTFEAYDYQGNLIGSESIQITTSGDNPVLDSLRITEINYNPADPTAVELASNPNLNNEWSSTRSSPIPTSHRSTRLNCTTQPAE